MAGYALPDAIEEAAIVSGCRDRDKEAFDALYRRYAPALRAYCRSRLRDPDRADDIAHEAVIRVYEALPRFKEGARFWSYLATVAANLCIDEHRRRSKLTYELPDSQVGHDLDEQLERRERVRLVQEALPTLPDRYRTLIQLQSLDGCSLGEIADLQGLSISAVKTALSRARRALRTSISSLAEQRGTAISGVVFFPQRGFFHRKWAAFTTKVRRLTLNPEPAAALPAASQALAALLAVAVVGIGAAPSEPATFSPASVQPASVESADVSLDASGAPPAHGGAQAVLLTDVVSQRADRLLSPGENAQPEDATIGSMTASRNYSSGRVLFASASLAGACDRPACPILFRSGDGGATWTLLPAVGFAGGTILLPPTYPRDSRIFASGPAGLQVSLDEGTTFAGLVGVVGPAAISPAFGSGDPRILIGAAPTWEYRDDLGTARPIAAAMVGGVVVNFAFSPQYPDDRRLFAGGTTLRDGSSQASAVFLCDGTAACQTIGKVSGSKGAPRLRLSPNISRDDTLFALAGENLYVSKRGGRDFSVLPAPLVLQGIALDPQFGFTNTTLYAATHTRDAISGGVWRSIDGGEAWVRLAGADQLLTNGASGIFTTPSGSILAFVAPGANGRRGLACSIDGGLSWSARCPVSG